MMMLMVIMLMSMVHGDDDNGGGGHKGQSSSKTPQGDEARHQLKTWASQLSWASQRAPMAKPGAWRSVGQGRLKRLHVRR